MSTQQNKPLVSAKELSLIETNVLSDQQLRHLFKRTPDKYVRQRPAKGGGTWAYVSGGYIRKCLNLMFGWDWDFEIISESVYPTQVVVKGKLTARVNGKAIVKMQYGCKEIMCRKGTDIPLNLGNDLKAAATDSLKKCAAELGIAADIYNADEFREVDVQVETAEQVNDNKETKRIADYIQGCTTKEALENVAGYVERYGLMEIFNAKLKEVDNGK